MLQHKKVLYFYEVYANCWHVLMWLNKKEKDGNCSHVSDGCCISALMSIKLKFNTVATAGMIEAEPSTKQCTEVLQVIKPNSHTSFRPSFYLEYQCRNMWKDSEKRSNNYVQAKWTWKAVQNYSLFVLSFSTQVVKSEAQIVVEWRNILNLRFKDVL